MKIKAMIVEDEELAQKRLLRLLKDFANKIEIIGIVDNGEDAVIELNRLQPELIFLDIRLPGKTGLEITEELEYRPWIVFTTAYDEFALQAFESYSVDYLLKPIRKEKLARALNKYENIKSEHQLKASNQKFVVKVGTDIIFLDFNDIMYFEAEKKYVEVHTKKNKYLLSDSLKQISLKLDSNFTQIFRSVIVNKNHIEKIVSLSSRKFCVRLNTGKELPLSSEGKKLLLG